MIKISLNHCLNPRRTITLALALLLLGGAVFAYTSGARNSLLKSRDQVADQKFQLEKAYRDVDQKIAQLQQQKYTIGRYLTDCDRALKDIDKALSAQDSALKGMR